VCEVCVCVCLSVRVCHSVGDNPVAVLLYILLIYKITVIMYVLLLSRENMRIPWIDCDECNQRTNDIISFILQTLLILLI